MSHIKSSRFFSKFTVDAIFCSSLMVISIIPIFTHLHILEDDFFEILASADGFFYGLGYCFGWVEKYLGFDNLTGITGRPPLIPFLLSEMFRLFGHTISTIYLLYLIPRLLILPLVYLISRFYLKPLTSFITSSLLLFFPFFETYSISTLKADIFVVFFSLISTLLTLYYLKYHKLHTLIFIGLFSSLNILSKETSVGFTLGIFSILFVTFYKEKKEISKKILLLFIPVLILLLPFILFSLNSTGRILPSIYATSRDFSSLPYNFTNYLLSAAKYLDISFGQSKIVALFSTFNLIAIIFGIVYLIKVKYYALLIPPVMAILLISTSNSAVIQANFVGNREILHRISFVAPFMAIYLALGYLSIGKYVGKVPKFKKNRQVFGICLLIIAEVYLINHYFRAPYALDYNQDEYYINASVITLLKPDIPPTTFSVTNGICLIEEISGGEFIREYYKNYRTGAFPPLYKETLIGAYLLSLLIGASGLWLSSNRSKTKKK